MKNISVLVLIFFLSLKVSMAQIPNFSFESWNNMGSYQNPDLWGTLNNFSSASSVYTATKGSPGDPGSYYLMLTSLDYSGGVLNGIAVSGKLDSINMRPKSGFTFNLRPKSFTGNWQHMIFGSSQGLIAAVLTKWNSALLKRDTIATINETLTGMVMSWESFTFDFTYQSGENPDSCIIFLKASGDTPSNQDYLYVDSLAFSGSVAAVENNAEMENGIEVFPNPAKQNIIIDLKGLNAKEITLDVTDLYGRLLITKYIVIADANSQQMLDVSSFAKGTYLLSVQTPEKTFTKKILVQ